MAEDLYSVLGVARAADADAIKKAYRKLAKDLHPDRNPGNKTAEDRFKKVNHAFDVLGDAKKRALYDEFGEDALREGFDPDRVRQYRNWSSQQRARGGAGYASNVNEVRLEDLFGDNMNVGGGNGIGDMFGDLFRGQQRRRGPMKGADLQSALTVDFASAVRGATVELRAQDGSSTPMTVRIPPGADEGSRVRIAGHGGASPNGGPPGDLILEIHVEPHPFFRRDGDDLHLDVPVTIAEAYRGGKVKVPTADGAVTIKVPPHTQSGSKLRVRGKGVARKGKETGDLYVHFMVHVPTQSSAELEKAIDAIAAAEPDDVRSALRF